MVPRALLVSLSLLLALSATAADVAVYFFSASDTRPGERAFVVLDVRNTTPEEPANIEVRITFDPRMVVEEVTMWPYLWECRTETGLVVCKNPEFRIGSAGTINMDVRTPASPEGGNYEFRAVVTSTTPDLDLTNNTDEMTLYLVRQVIVSNTNDSGPGSLRQGILDVNAVSTLERPSDLRFRIDSTTRPVIEPLSPLPALTACRVQVGDPPRLWGDPVPVAVEINGRHAGSGPGLELRHACSDRIMSLYGIAVNGFPEDGIAITAPLNYHLHGFEVLGNGRRGISVTANAWLFLDGAVIGQNVRTGLALFDGRAFVARSRIGIGADGADLGNGASGIFIAPTAWDLTLNDSIVANHAHFGLALAGKTWVSISTSTVIKHNVSDLDWFLDGPSAPRRQDIPNTPRLLGARHDAAANVTRVTFTLDHPSATASRNIQVRLYASDRITITGTAHLEKVIGFAEVRWKDPIAGSYTVDVAGDLRGQYVSAVTTFLTVQEFPDSPSPTMMSTSEVSTALKVE